MRVAEAAQLHELALWHSLRRLGELEQQLQAVLPRGNSASASAAVVQASSSLDAARPAGHGSLASPGAALLHGAAGAGGSANPAAALLAATRGSPGTARHAASRRLSQQQLQAAAARVAEAAAAAAAALGSMRQPDGVAALQVHCEQAFAPLLHHISTSGQPEQPCAAALSSEHQQQQQQPNAAWSWLEGARLHAAGRHEAALRVLTAASPAGNPLFPEAAHARLVADCYAAVGDAAGLRACFQVWAAQLCARSLAFHGARPVQHAVCAVHARHADLPTVARRPLRTAACLWALHSALEVGRVRSRGRRQQRLRHPPNQAAWCQQTCCT